MPKVLIVDDALTDRVRVSGIASKWQHCEVLEAENGRAAMEQIEAHHPDLVLTDLHMPEMDGLELVTAIKDEYPHLPVVLMTAQGSEDVAAEALRRGATSYVPKSRLADDLADTLNQVFCVAQVAHSQFRLMHHMTDTVTNFVLPNDPTLMRACVDEVLNMLRCLPLGDRTERIRVGIAVEEAMNNACYHGNLEVNSAAREDLHRDTNIAMERSREEPYAQRRIHVSVSINRERAKFVIRDEGPGFDTSGIQAEGDTSSGSSNRGRGITLMQSIMDEVEFNEQGNQVTMVRRAIQNDDAE